MLERGYPGFKEAGLGKTSYFYVSKVQKMTHDKIYLRRGFLLPSFVQQMHGYILKAAALPQLPMV